MKKSIKLLVLVLTLVLVCGVFMFSAFAADESGVGYDYANYTNETGEILFSYMDFEKTDFVSDTAANFQESNGNFVNSGTNMKTNNNRSFQLVFANRSGKVFIDSVPQQANKYLVIWNDATTLARAGQNPYASVALYRTNPGNGTNADANPDSMMYTYQATVIDYDIKFGEGVVPTGTGFGIHFRRYNASGARDFFKFTGANGGGEISSANVYYRTEGDKIKLYTQDSNWTTSTTNVPAQEWVHFTIVWSAPVDDNGTPDDKADDKFESFNLYVYMNDVLVLESHNLDYLKTYTSDDFYKGQMTNVNMSEARLMFGLDNFAGAAEVAFDNVAVRNYTYDYDMTGLNASLESGDLSTWSGSVYDEALLPYGTTLASIERDGEKVEFDDLADAIAAAGEDETVKLEANVSGQITLNKAIVINKNGFTANLVAANGYAVFDGDRDDEDPATDGTYYCVESTGSLRVMWGACKCGKHIKATNATVGLNANIYDSYEAATGNVPECTYIQDGKAYTLIGWTISGNAGLTNTTLSKDQRVASSMIGKTMRLAPVYEEKTVVAEIIGTDGAIKKTIESGALSEILSAAQNGETVKLHANFDYITTSAISIQNAITLDLNGYRISDLYAGTTKHYSFSLRNDLHVTSSRAGGAIYSAMYNTNNGAYVGNSIFCPGKAGVSLYIDGADENGNTTVAMYCPTIVQGYGSYINCYIDGGEYHRTATDNFGMFDMRAASEVVIKNAYVNGGGRLFRNCKTSGAVSGAAPIVTIDNCIIDGTIMDNNASAVDADTVLTITNSYINGNINTVNGTFILGEGVFLADGVTYSGVQFAEGTEARSMGYTKTYTVHPNKFEYDKNNDTWGGATFAPTAQDKTISYSKVVIAKNAEPVKVTWRDTEGNVIGVTNDTFAGLPATAPTTEVEGTNGWVMVSYSDWSDNAVIPFGVTEYEFTLQENSGVTYSGGKVNVMFNFDMIAHYQYNFYIPYAPEGIEFVGAQFAGSVGSGYVEAGSSLIKESADTNGNKYMLIHRWPGAVGVAQISAVTINYTYNGANLSYTSPSFTIADYANYFFNTDKYEGAPIVNAMADMLRYVKAANTLNDKETTSEFNAIYAAAQEYMTPDAALKTETIDLSVAEAYISKVEIGFNAGLNGMSIAVTPAEGTTYGIGFKAVYEHGKAVIGQSRMLSKDGIFRAHNIRTWGIAETFTIQIYTGYTIHTDGQSVLFTGEELVAEFDYSLAAYLGEHQNELNAKELEFVKAILAYGSSAGEYMDWLKDNGLGT